MIKDFEPAYKKKYTVKKETTVSEIIFQREEKGGAHKFAGGGCLSLTHRAYK